MKKITITFYVLSLLMLFSVSVKAVVVEQDSSIQTGSTSSSHRIFELEFNDARIGDVIRVLAEQTGKNIIATQEANKKTVSIYLKDVSLKEAIESICRISGLWYRQNSDNDTFRIMTIEEYSKDLVIHQDDEIRVFELLNPNVKIIAQTIEDIYGQRVILSLGLDPAGTKLQFLKRRRWRI